MAQRVHPVCGSIWCWWSSFQKESHLFLNSFAGIILSRSPFQHTNSAVWKPSGQIAFDGFLYHAGAAKPIRAPRFSQVKVAAGTGKSEAVTPRGGVRQYGDVRQFGVGKLRQFGGGFGHLHQREGAFHHTGTARLDMMMNGVLFLMA